MYWPERVARGTGNPGGLWIPDSIPWILDSKANKMLDSRLPYIVIYHNDKVKYQ